MKLRTPGALLIALSAIAQERPVLTTADYAHAESFLFYRTNPLVFHSNVRPTWLADGRFWYRISTPEGTETILVDSATGAKQRVTDGQFTKPDPNAPAVAPNEIVSPDGKRAVFIRDYNLWMRELRVPDVEVQLTKDGVKDFGYATDNAGWVRSDRPVVVWSPDSTKIATFQQDERSVGDMYLVDAVVGHPRLVAWKYPMAGDPVVATIQRVIIDVGAGRVVRLQMPPDAHRSTWCDDLACRGDWGDVQWNPDSSEIALASVSRDHRHVQVQIASARTGAVREMFEEKAATFFGSALGHLNWKYVAGSHEIVWCSERDNFSQLYLYDAASGQLKNRITTGEGPVVRLLRVDEKNRLIYFTASGKERGRDPYLEHLYRVGFDGANQSLLTPEDANHGISLSPDARYFTDSYSRPDFPPVSVLRDSTGKSIATLERADVSRLLATGWKPPVPITVKARDGITDLYGLMFEPTRLDQAKKYPIINHVYPGGSVGTRSFLPSRTDSQSLAELGFIVVEVDGLGTVGRSKSFYDFSYGNLGDATIPDQIAAMKQLAERYPWIDLDRAGIHGHSGGGQATAAAMFMYPDFFKVGVAQAGDHENRAYEDDWVESAQGMLEVRADGTTNYDNQANQNFAKNLKGHLLLAHGTMDSNVPMYNTLLVVSALIKANKDFDLLLLPGRNHGFGSEPYMIRRRWDYFVRYLLGADPPEGYELHPPAPARP